MSPQTPYFAGVAALMGDPARANILALLLDGRARTAKELAFAAVVSAQTTSGHLAKLLQARLLESAAQGRFRYFRLAGPDVAAALEALAVLAAQEPRRPRAFNPAEEQLRAARTCYDHLAGRLGVAVMEALLGAKHLAGDGEGLAVTPRGALLFDRLGIDVEAVARGRAASRGLAWTGASGARTWPERSAQR